MYGMMHNEAEMCDCLPLPLPLTPPPLQDELMEGVVLPLLQPVAGDPDSDVRCRAVQLLTHLVSEATPSWAVHSLAIINSVSMCYVGV